MAAPLVYLNGQFILGPLAIPAWDAGFVFGATVTDLVRTFGGQLFRLDDHLARFRQSCRLCRMPLPVDDGKLKAAAERLVEHNFLLLPDVNATFRAFAQFQRDGRTYPAQELGLVIVATPGPLGHYA